VRDQLANVLQGLFGLAQCVGDSVHELSNIDFAEFVGQPGGAGLQRRHVRGQGRQLRNALLGAAQIHRRFGVKVELHAQLAGHEGLQAQLRPQPALDQFLCMPRLFGIDAFDPIWLDLDVDRDRDILGLTVVV
jgi:hypothetical protein